MAGLRFNNGDAISAALLAGLGAYILIEAREWPYMGPDGPGPAFFPTWYGIALIALSLVVIVARLWTLRSSAGNGKKMSAAERREVLHALVVWLAFAITIALLKVLGFMLAFGLFTFFIVALIYRRPWATAVTVGAASAVSFYLVFTVALGVELPPGMFGF
jgi:putative tricarboxylic transport membrane protein